MGNTSGNTNMRREIWIRKVLYEASQEMYFSKHGMVSTEEKGGNGILLRKDNLKKEKGDKNTAQAKTKENKKNKQDRSTAGSSAGKTKQVKSKEKAQESPAKRAERRRRPGQMTEEQAQNLFDSLKGEEKATPMIAGNRGKGKGRQDKERRDW